MTDGEVDQFHDKILTCLSKLDLCLNALRNLEQEVLQPLEMGGDQHVWLQVALV